MERKHIYRLLEFLIIGVVLGVTEDVIAVTLSTGAHINWNIILIIILVAIPFAAFSELVVDHEDFGLFGRKRKKK